MLISCAMQPKIQEDWKTFAQVIGHELAVYDPTQQHFGRLSPEKILQKFALQRVQFRRRLINLLRANFQRRQP
jgi:predicted RNA-binding protein (virulence factor B family)